MAKVLTRSKSGFTHYFALDAHNVVPEYFTGTFNTVVYATGITGQIDGSIPTAVVNGAYYVCTRGGTSNGQVFMPGHIYLGVSGVWVNQGLRDGMRMVPTVDLYGNDMAFTAGLEYKWTEYSAGAGHRPLQLPTSYKTGKWSITGEAIATTPTAYCEAPSSTMRYGVGQYTVEATRAAGNITVYYTVDSIEQFRQDPRTVSWKNQATLTDTQMTQIASPVTAVKLVFSDTTPGMAAVVVN